jgi:dihydroneopterin aldolase
VSLIEALLEEVVSVRLHHVDTYRQRAIAVDKPICLLWQFLAVRENTINTIIDKLYGAKRL